MSLVELVIPAREADIGALKVRRLLPWRERRMVGPFIFLDHMGPADFAANRGIDVLPHPHIGLATITYLFEGDIHHRDTLGSSQHIRPGDVNLMAAGRGIAHSERTGVEARRHPHRVNGLQSWVALPAESEDSMPEFLHYPQQQVPLVTEQGMRLKVVAGEAYGVASPVKTHSPLFYIDAFLDAGRQLELPHPRMERGLYVLSGTLRIGGQEVSAPALPVFSTGKVMIEAVTPAHVMQLGGDRLPEPRYIWWNFVSSSKDRLKQAKEDWKAGKFGLIPGDDKEFVPLPELPKPGNIL